MDEEVREIMEGRFAQAEEAGQRQDVLPTQIVRRRRHNRRGGRRGTRRLAIAIAARGGDGVGAVGARTVMVTQRVAMRQCPANMRKVRRARAARRLYNEGACPDRHLGFFTLVKLFQEPRVRPTVSLLYGLFNGYKQPTDGGEELLVEPRAGRIYVPPLACVVLDSEAVSEKKYLRLQEQGAKKREENARKRRERHLTGRVVWRRNKIAADVRARLVGVARTAAAVLMAKRTAEQSYAALFKDEVLRQRCTLESVLLEVLEYAIKPSEGEMKLIRPLTGVEFEATQRHYQATRNDCKYVWTVVGMDKQEKSLPPVRKCDRASEPLWSEAKERTKVEFEERLRKKFLGTLLHSASKTLARVVYYNTWRNSHVGVAARNLAMH